MSRSTLFLAFVVLLLAPLGVAVVVLAMQAGRWEVVTGVLGFAGGLLPSLMAAPQGTEDR